MNYRNEAARMRARVERLRPLTAKDLKPFMVLERDELDWDDNLVPVRWRVEMDVGYMMLFLVQRTPSGAFVDSVRVDRADLSEFRKAT